MTFDINKLRIAVIGLGYVGLPLGVEFGNPSSLVYDINYVLPADASDDRL